MIDPPPGFSWDDAHQGMAAAGQRRAARLMAGLTASELSLLGHIAAGLSGAEIQIETKLSDEALIELRRRLFNSINARTTADAMRIASYARID